MATSPPDRSKELRALYAWEQIAAVWVSSATVSLFLGWGAIFRWSLGTSAGSCTALCPPFLPLVVCSLWLILGLGGLGAHHGVSGRFFALVGQGSQAALGIRKPRPVRVMACIFCVLSAALWFYETRVVSL